MDFELIKTVLRASRKSLDPCQTRKLNDYERFYQTVMELVSKEYVKAGLPSSSAAVTRKAIELFTETLELVPPTEYEIEKALFNYET